MARLKRVNYFTGQLLNAADLQAEQEYHLEKHRRHNLLFHGSGIVTGLDISIANDKDGSSVTIGPGHAVDPLGNDIDLCAAVKLRLPKSAAALLVELRYTESLTDPVSANSGTTGDETQPSRIEEGGEVALLKQPPPTSLTSSAGVVLARLIPTPRGWRLDRRHKLRRTR
jgi:hypothetical protein